MSPSRVHVLLSIRLGFLLACIGLVLGNDPPGRYDVLHGNQGERSCTLRDSIVGNCNPSKRRDYSPSSIHGRDNTQLVPSLCTCNTIFFNIWSACSYSSGNNTLPNFTNWMQTCTNKSVDTEKSAAFSQVSGNLGISVPSWANLAVPGNTSFDLQRAVVTSSPPPIRWTNVQIMLPIVASLMTLFILGVLLLVYNRILRSSRGSTRMGWPKNLKHLQLRPSHKVTASFDRTDGWEIDQDDTEAMKQPRFVQFAPSIAENTNTFSGQPIRAPRVDPEPVDDPESDETSKSVLNPIPKTEKRHSFRIPTRPMRLPVPWKRRPPQIKLVPATHRFRVDDVNKSSGTNTEEGRNGFGRMDESDGEPVDVVDQFTSPEDEEGTNLITSSPEGEEPNPDEAVIVISKNGRPFTLESRSTNTASVNSHINIVSPSTSSTSPRSTMGTVPTKPTLHIPIPPPLPNHAAPAPPIMSRGTTDRPSEPSLTHFSSRSFLSPIMEASPSNSFSSSNSSLRRAPGHIRRPSNSESISSIYTSPAVRSSPNPNSSSRLPPHYSDLHRTSSQYSELSQALDGEPDEPFFDAYAEFSNVRQSAGHRGTWDSDASFYCASPQPVQTQPLSPNPATFFPGPVRAAGYPRTYIQVQQGDPF